MRDRFADVPVSVVQSTGLVPYVLGSWSFQIARSFQRPVLIEGLSR